VVSDFDRVCGFWYHRELCRTRYFYSHVCPVAVVGGGCCVENVVFFITTIAYLYEFTVSSGINIQYLTSILVLCWLKGVPTMNTVALSISHICILLTTCS
jgi:hypothetical protein